MVEFSSLYSSKYRMERLAKVMVKIQFENKIDLVAWEKSKCSPLSLVPHPYLFSFLL
jgi:hypothetical protein